MKMLTVSLALLLAATLNSAPAEDVTGEQQVEISDFDFAIPEFELPELEMIDMHEFDMLAFSDEDKHDRGKRMHKHAERIQLYRLWRIMEELDLTEDQVDKFFPLMRGFGKKEKELAHKRQALVKSLREELRKEKSSESQLKQMLTDLKRNATQMIESKNEAIEKGAKILSIEQQARMALKLHEVERNIWESIAHVRRMPSGRDLGESGFDKQKMQLNMQQLRENLNGISKSLEARGFPGFDVDIDLDQFGDVDKPLEEEK
jgi:hypothetical protein